jgi:uncharacterized damage-inducible protein DinB
MRRVAVLMFALWLAGVSLPAQAPAGAQGPVARSLQSAWNTAKGYIVQSAEVMPEENYGFRPADTVRTFGQILAHVAGANHLFCAAAKGTTTKITEDQFEKTATTRAAIVKALADSMAYCDSVFAGLTDGQLSDPIEMPFGMGKDVRSAAILGNIGHLNEHYGNLVTYMRIKGIVPPSSRR